MSLKNKKGSIKYLELTSGWRFFTAEAEVATEAPEIYNCTIEETDRNTFLVKTRTDVVKEYFPSAIHDVTYHFKKTI